MIRRRLFPLIGSVLASFFVGRAAAAKPPDCRAFQGRWGGTLGEGAGALRLVLEIGADGEASLVSVDQGGSRFAASGGSCTPTGLNLQFDAVRGTLAVTRDGTDLAGTWSQGRPMPLRLSLLAAGTAAPARPAVVTGPLKDEVAAALAASRASAMIGGWQRGSRADVVVAGQRTPGGVKATQGDLWHIGSITKSMTGTLLARLIQAGTLQWDTRATDILGPAGVTVHEGLKDVTLLDLVTGRSGLASNIPMTRFLRFPRQEADPRASRLAYASVALGAAPEARPGQGFTYPNAGFVVAGCMAEVRTGRSWEDLMRAEVFGPLGLASAGFGPPPLDQSASGLQPGLFGGAPRPAGAIADNPAVLGPAGTVHMTLQDLLAFGAAHVAGASGARNAYLPQAAWRALHTPPEGSRYAVGWVCEDDGARWHNGSNTLWLANLWIRPASGVVVAAAANFADTDAQIDRILEAARQAALA